MQQKIRAVGTVVQQHCTGKDTEMDSPYPNSDTFTLINDYMKNQPQYKYQVKDISWLHVIQKWEMIDGLIVLPTEPEHTLLNLSMSGINCLS